jgi:hypothetical protein
VGTEGALGGMPSGLPKCGETVSDSGTTAPDDPPLGVAAMQPIAGVTPSEAVIPDQIAKCENELARPRSIPAAGGLCRVLI